MKNDVPQVIIIQMAEQKIEVLKESSRSTKSIAQNKPKQNNNRT